MPAMAPRAPYGSSSSSIGPSRVCPSPGTASSISLVRCTRPKSNLDRMVPSRCIARLAWDALGSLSLSALCWSACSTKVCSMYSKLCGFYAPSDPPWCRLRWDSKKEFNKYMYIFNCFIYCTGPISLLLPRRPGVSRLVWQLCQLSRQGWRDAEIEQTENG